MKNLRKILEKRYGRAKYDFEGKKIAGILYGNHEMWESDKFYQELLSDDNKVYRVFYNLPENQDLEDIDYDSIADIKSIEDMTDEATRYFCETEEERMQEIRDYILDASGIDKSEYLDIFCPVCKIAWDDMEEDCGHYTRTMIKYYRLEKGWSLRELAEKLGYKSQTLVANWETGERNPTLSSIKKLAEAFEIDFIGLIR